MAHLFKTPREVRTPDHACAFYRNTPHQVSIAAPYLHAALTRHERCVYIVDEVSPEHVLAEMKTQGHDITAAVKNGQLTLHHAADVYFLKGHFAPQTALTFFAALLKASGQQGYAGLAIVGSAGPSTPISERPLLLEYEQTAADHFQGQPVSGICLYHEGAFARSFLKHIEDAHPVTAVGHCPHLVDYVRLCHIDRSGEHVDHMRRMVRQLCSNGGFDTCAIYQEKPLNPPVKNSSDN